MIRHIELLLQLSDQDRYVPHLAYALYGELCHQMSEPLAEMLHEQEITPIRQHLRKENDTGLCTWVIDLFNTNDELVNLLQQQKEINLEKCKGPIQVLNCQVQEPVNIASLLMDSAEWKDNPIAEITFETPTTFKTNGQYALFPSASLIVQSLFLRWNALIPECSMDDPDALRMLCEGISIRRYHLSSRDYYIKGQRITGFTGTISLHAYLSAPMQELWHMLLAFLPYSGLGIKTTLGMGAAKAKPLIRQENNSSGGK